MFISLRRGTAPCRLLLQCSWSRPWMKATATGENKQGTARARRQHGQHNWTAKRKSLPAPNVPRKAQIGGARRMRKRPAAVHLVGVAVPGGGSLHANWGP